MKIEHVLTIPPTLQGMRLDQALAQLLPQYSRSRMTQWIKDEQVTCNGHFATPKHKVDENDAIVVDAQLVEIQHDLAQAIPLNIVFEDESLLVINKPAGLVVHPAAGNPNGTLLNALLHHAPSVRTLPRCGIVHRLDKDTTGLMVVAKTVEAHTHLVSQLQQRDIERRYFALVGAELITGATVDAPIGRHASNRLKMAVSRQGKPARTHFQCHKKWPGFTLLDVQLESGRTHQIRVHLAHHGSPIVGDALYGWRLKWPKGAHASLIEALVQFKRQALHAYALSFAHPITGAPLAFQAPLPNDFADLIVNLNGEQNNAMDKSQLASANMG